MAKLRSYDFCCGGCPILEGEPNPDVAFDALVSITNDGPNGAEDYDLPPCPECGEAGRVIRVPSAPNILKASWPDGRKRPDSWYIAKEAASLRKQAFNRHPDKREELVGAARKLESEAHKRNKPEG